ncbi:hypothetical protein K1719_036576 [Acacia pycnantha]|nr:hypothetical protein K1719_036576 [Acacia pycnantha]
MSLILSKKVSVKSSSSSEEEDFFLRSVKKVKNNEGTSMVNEWPKLGKEGDKPWFSGPSFAEKLQGKKSQKVEETLPDDRGQPSEVNMASGEVNSSDFDVWKVVNKPRRIEVHPVVADTPGGSLDAKRDPFVPEGVDKRGKGNKKQGRGKSRAGDRRWWKEEGPKALDLDDMWEEEAQVPNFMTWVAGMGSACDMEDEAQGMVEGGTVVPETQAPAFLMQNIKTACWSSRPCFLFLSETKCENEGQLSCLSKLGFDGSAFMPSAGRFGGLIAIWKKDQISVDVLRKERQFLHFRCSVPGKGVFFLTSVYAIPQSAFKQILWQELSALSSTISSPIVSSPVTFQIWDSMDPSLLGVALNRLIAQDSTND